MIRAGVCRARELPDVERLERGVWANEGPRHRLPNRRDDVRHIGGGAAANQDLARLQARQLAERAGNARDLSQAQLAGG